MGWGQLLLNPNNHLLSIMSHLLPGAGPPAPAFSTSNFCAMKITNILALFCLLLMACHNEPPSLPGAPTASPAHSCPHPPDTLVVRGFYNLDSCLVRLNIQPDANGKWCYLPEGETATAACPGWEGFIVLLEGATGQFTVESPLRPVRSSGLPVRVWAEPLCSYPGSFDNAATGSLPGNRFFATVLLSENYLDCLLNEPGFWFEMKVLQSKH